MTNKLFTVQDRQTLEDIIIHRRDVRGNRFTNQDVSEEAINKLLFAALHAPSVGYSQPWEFVVIRNLALKQQVKDSYERENTKATDIFKDRPLYQKLRLEGIIEAPVNIAVFYKPSSQPVLGQTSMNQVGLYSVVCAMQNMWLMARAQNMGLGWVSILDEAKVKQILKAPPENQLVAYLCIGYVAEFLERPELEMLGWEKYKGLESVIYYD